MLIRRLRFWLGGAKRRRALQEEIELHVAEMTADLRAEGFSESEAYTEARRRFGSPTRTVEDARDVWSLVWLDLLLRDIRYGGRALGRNPGFAAVLVIILALGIGANTAMFSIVDHLLLRSLPFPDAERLVMVYETPRGAENHTREISPADWIDWKRESRSFESLAAWADNEATERFEGGWEELEGQAVSPEFFPILGVAPLMGRAFRPEDDFTTVILSYGLWQSRFGGAPDIVGRTILLRNRQRRVIGVMPQDFRFVGFGDFWTLLGVTAERNWRAIGGTNLYVIGRLKSGIPLASAQAEMKTVGSRLAQLYPSNKDTSITIVPLREELRGNVKRPLWLLFAAVCALLLIACANFASLLLARSAYRRTELVVRAALGAGRAALLRQSLTEGVLLALTGGVIGLILARVVVAVMIPIAPVDVLEAGAIHLDARVLLYTLAMSVLTGAVFGLAPAVSAFRVSPVNLVQTTRSTTPRSAQFRRGLVVAQLALTVVLLCGAGLFMRSFRQLMHKDMGFNPYDIVTMHVGQDRDLTVGFYEEALEQIRKLPGVRSASAEQGIPVIDGGLSGPQFHIAGTPEANAEQPSAKVRMVTPGYFQTLGIPILRGRDFSVGDDQGSPLAFIVNDAFAKVFFPNRDPLTASISIPRNIQRPGDPSRLRQNRYGRIIAVVGDIKEGSLRGQATPTIFFTYTQIRTSDDMIVFVKTDGRPGTAQAAVQVIEDMDAGVPVTRVRLLEDVFIETIARERFIAVFSGAFSLIALLLAASGIYGLLSYHVVERTQEIGIRMALGGRSSEIMRMILAQSLRLIIPGAALGLAGALAFVRSIESLLYGIPTRDPSTFVGVVALLVAVGALAALLPAVRAARVDPLIALRQE